MKKITLSLAFLMLSTLTYADSITKDAFVKADTNTTNTKDKALYMPRLITPDELKSGVYGGLAFSLSSLAANSSPSIFFDKNGNNRMTDLAIVAGYNFNRYLATEARGMVSYTFDNGVDFKNLGIYLKPKYEVYKGVTIYSLLGVGRISAKDVHGNSLKAGETNVQLGFGADYKLPNNFKVFADYTYLGKDSKGKLNNKNAIFKASAITTGITYDF